MVGYASLEALGDYAMYISKPYLGIEQIMYCYRTLWFLCKPLFNIFYAVRYYSNL